LGPASRSVRIGTPLIAHGVRTFEQLQKKVPAFCDEHATEAAPSPH
jgi:hypothetical protein